MTFSELKDLVGNGLQSRLEALSEPEIGLYYDHLPSSRPRLCVRFWFPVSGSVSGGYDALGSVERPLLQVDVFHSPDAGSVQTPAPEKAEAVWEAVKLTALPGIAGMKRGAAGRPPAKDPTDGSLWGFHRYQLTVT